MSNKERSSVDYKSRLGLFNNPTQATNHPSSEDKQSDTSVKEETNDKEELKSETDDGSAKMAVLTVKMSPTLHNKYKILCISEQTTMQDDVFKFVKRRVGKPEKK